MLNDIQVFQYFYKVMYNALFDILNVKAIPLQAWAGPEGSRSLRLQDFKTIGT
jgi:hypothetical protein